MSLVKNIAFILYVGESVNIQTPSFIFSVYKLNSKHLPPKLTIHNCLFSLPSFCKLTKRNSCKNEQIILKVNSTNNLLLYFSLLILLKIMILPRYRYHFFCFLKRKKQYFLQYLFPNFH